MILWFYAIGLSVLALGLVAWPLLTKSSDSGQSKIQEQPQKCGRLCKANFILLGCLSLFVFASTFLLYWHWGAYERINQVELVRERITEVKKEISQSGSRQSLISQFEAHLKQNPGSANGWYLLGKLYLHDGRNKDAVEALRKSKALDSNNAETLLALAQALFLVHDNTLNSEAQTLLLQVIKKDPESPVALTLLATDEYNKGHYKQALSYFEQLLPYYPAESKDGKHLLEIIAQVQKHIQ
jgi:cytochrome c-type biogenesis protein CcmH/NrfG